MRRPSKRNRETNLLYKQQVAYISHVRDLVGSNRKASAFLGLHRTTIQNGVVAHAKFKEIGEDFHNEFYDLLRKHQDDRLERDLEWCLLEVRALESLKAFYVRRRY